MREATGVSAVTVGAHADQLAVQPGRPASLHFPSARRRPARDGRNERGRRVTAKAVDGPFVHVTRDNRCQMGLEGDLRGAGGATCKTAGFAYTGSNPVPATLPLSCGNGFVLTTIVPSAVPCFP